MNEPEVGELYFYPNFTLSSGEVKGKFLMVVAKNDFNLLFVTCTSQKKARQVVVGCVNVNTQWHSWCLPQPSFGCLTKPTWLSLSEVYEMGVVSFKGTIKSGMCFYKARSNPKNMLACLLQNIDDIASMHQKMIQTSYDALPPSSNASFV